MVFSSQGLALIELLQSSATIQGKIISLNTTFAIHNMPSNIAKKLHVVAHSMKDESFEKQLVLNKII